MPGYGAKTVEPPKAALICPECNMILRDAVQTGDGIRLCETCFKQFQEYPNHTSPKSGMTVGKDYYPDKAVRREIFQLIVLCLHSIFGCPWQGQLQHFEAHCRDCKYKPMRCPNPGCSELLPAEKLDSHVDGECPFRKVACNHCREETAANQLEDHLNRCPKVPMECGRCPEWVARDALKEHQLRDCSYVECPAPGCGEILLRNGTETEPNTIASHLTNPLILFQHMVALFTFFGNGFQKLDQLETQFIHLESTSHQHSTHLGQLTKGYTELQQRTKELLERMPILEKQNGTKMDKNWTARLSSLEERQSKMEQTIRTLHSQHSTGGVRCPEGSGSGYEIRVMDLEKRVEELYRQQAALKTHTSELEMQLQASLASTHNGSFSRRITEVHDQGTQGGRLNTGGSRELHPISSENLDQLIRRAQSGPIQALTSCSAREVEHLQPSCGANIWVLQNESYVWRICNVSRYRRSTAAIRSPPFLTAHTGYKMCIEACLNGDGTGYNTHLSLRFVLMKGEYDPLLKWPFDYKVTFILIDQTHRRHIWDRFQPDHDNPSFQRPKSDSNVPYSVPQFTELSVLNERYVKDDVMYIKCIIDTTNMFHP